MVNQIQVKLMYFRMDNIDKKINQQRLIHLLNLILDLEMKDLLKTIKVSNRILLEDNRVVIKVEGMRIHSCN